MYKFEVKLYYYKVYLEKEMVGTRGFEPPTT